MQLHLEPLAYSQQPALAPLSAWDVLSSLPSLTSFKSLCQCPRLHEVPF